MLKLKKSKRKLLKTAALLMVAGVPAALASVPRSAEIANDTAIYQNLHEIRISKEKSLDFDSDIERLSGQEKLHRKALPLRVSAPMERVMNTSYRPSPAVGGKVLKRTHRARSRSN